MEIQTIEYHKVFNLGNYSNEKIGVTIAIAPGENPIDAFAEAKRTVEKSHLFFQQLPDYEKAQQVVADPKNYTGYQVERSEQAIKAFEANFPDYISRFVPANRTIEQGLTDEYDREEGY